ncbi:MAG: hypothetical protein ABWZ40_04170 [Caulobacterales bacterium]
MPRYTMVVMTNPKPGQEEEFNHWYTNIHLKEVCEVPGIKSARRFKHSRGLPEGAGLDAIKTGTEYLALYEIETNNIDAVLKSLTDSVDKMNMTDSMQMRGLAEFYEEIAAYPR